MVSSETLMGFSTMAEQRFRHISLETNDCSGSVWSCYDEWTGTIVSVKKIYVADMNRIAALMREITLLLELNHPNVVRFLDVVMCSDSIKVVSEHLDCDLLMYIEKNQQMLTQAKIKDFLRQILQGIAYCHSKNVFHGKLTPKNLLMDCTNSNVKLAGFGLTGTDAFCHTTNHQMGQPGSYTPWEIASAYKAPEVLLLPDNRSFPADVWAAGCILALLLTKQHLFIMKNKHGHIPSTTQLDHILSQWSSSHNHKSLVPVESLEKQQDLSARLEFSDAAGLDLINRMLRVDPKQRITANDALAHEYLNTMDE
ncbi:Cell division control protein 2 homolog [Linum grandiflorum]